MKVAVIGSNGREHAIVKALLGSKRCEKIIAIPGNAGMAELVNCVPVLEQNTPQVVRQCVQHEVDYAVVSSPVALNRGLVDALEEEGISAFGPGWAAARLEGSKIFAKNLMRKHGIPTAPFRVFDDVQRAQAHVRTITHWPVVIKPDGPTYGFGLFICRSAVEAVHVLQALMVDRFCGSAGERVVVEDYLEGTEVFVMAFCDGQRVVTMPAGRNLGDIRDALGYPNSVSCGAIAPHPAYTPEVARRCTSEIFLPTVQALAEATSLYRGCLYFGLMLTADGPKVLEYNCRFGDPECTAVLPLLHGDLLEVMLACTHGCLKPGMFEVAPEYGVSLEITTAGYPGPSFTGLPIMGLDERGGLPGVDVYHNGTRKKEGRLITGGGRVLTLAATAPRLSDAVQRLYEAAKQVRFSGARHHRLLAEAAKVMEATGMLRAD